jgi:uncharacterized protein (UPF0548 family)
LAAWRFGRGWPAEDLEDALTAHRGLDLNYDPAAAKTLAHGWRHVTADAPVARERPGQPEPGGPFERAWEAVVGYEFSDPRIVIAHFDRAAPLHGRTMLLELKALGFRFLAGTRVTDTRRDSDHLHTTHGFRYDTLQGHIEAGWEWFLLTKSHATGEVRFRIEATWRPGDFPNAWSRLGFRFLGRHYQRRWTRRAHQRLRIAAGTGETPLPGAC